MRRSDYEDDEPEELYFDDDMMLAWEAYMMLQTQWNFSINGPTGINYASLPLVMDVLDIKDKRLFMSDIQVIECKALEMIRYKK